MRTLSSRPLKEHRTPHFITVTHTHTHVFVSAEHTLGTLWSRRHLENDSWGGQKTSIPINVHSSTDPGLTSPHIASRVRRGTFKNFGSNAEISHHVTIRRHEITLMITGALGTKDLFMSSSQSFRWNFPKSYWCSPSFEATVVVIKMCWAKKRTICSPHFHYYLKRFDLNDFHPHL